MLILRKGFPNKTAHKIQQAFTTNVRSFVQTMYILNDFIRYKLIRTKDRT